jgi:hypothetical protein
MLNEDAQTLSPWLNEPCSIKPHEASISNCDDKPVHIVYTAVRFWWNHPPVKVLPSIFLCRKATVA